MACPKLRINEGVFSYCHCEKSRAAGDEAIQPAFAVPATAWLRWVDGPSRSLGGGWLDRRGPPGGPREDRQLQNTPLTEGTASGRGGTRRNEEGSEGGLVNLRGRNAGRGPASRESRKGIDVTLIWRKRSRFWWGAPEAAGDSSRENLY